MAKYQHFEELPVWQEAARLYNAVLDLLEEPNLPLTSGFRNQLDRASLSISNNIAEGFEPINDQRAAFFYFHFTRLGRRGALDDGSSEEPTKAQGLLG